MIQNRNQYVTQGNQYWHQRFPQFLPAAPHLQGMYDENEDLRLTSGNFVTHVVSSLLGAIGLVPHAGADVGPRGDSAEEDEG